MKWRSLLEIAKSHKNAILIAFLRNKEAPDSAIGMTQESPRISAVFVLEMEAVAIL
jgi:hypothetical protein